MQAGKQFDLVVFGATGFTGARICRYLSRRENRQTKIAVAGRNRAQLDELVTGLKVAWDVIIASYESPSSIAEMAAKTRVIINCVGPYRHFGLVLPEACVHAHTDYVDVCGEPEFLERTQLECHELATAAGVLLVGACGFDSICSDLAAMRMCEHLIKKGASSIDSIECFLTLKYGEAGVAVHYPTYESLVYGIANVSKLKEIRRKLDERQPRQQKSKQTKKWSMPFLGADAAVLRRSFKFFGSRPGPAISIFITVSSFLWALILSVWGLIFMLLCEFPFSRSLLLQFPYLFSMGTVTKSGPTETQINGTSFEVNVFGKGSGSGSSPVSTFQSQFRVSGPEPGYVATPIMATEAAFTLLLERSKIRQKGGVLTPATAFEGTSLIENLHQAGILFDIIE